MDKLIDGYRRFRETYWHQNRDVFAALANGQSPQAMVIACSDSRIDPQLIFGSGPGEIFTVRNVANLVPPYAPDSEYHGTSAALEFAVRTLKVRHVIVLGHAACGGIRALLQGAPPNAADFVVPWMGIARSARDAALAATEGDLDAAQPICEHEAIRVSLQNLLTFPWVRDAVEAGELSLHGWWFDLETGDLHLLDEGEFRPVAA